jgi:hypothetical protein
MEEDDQKAIRAKRMAQMRGESVPSNLRRLPQCRSQKDLEEWQLPSQIRLSSSKSRGSAPHNARTDLEESKGTTGPYFNC